MLEFQKEQKKKEAEAIFEEIKSSTFFKSDKLLLCTDLKRRGQIKRNIS